MRNAFAPRTVAAFPSHSITAYRYMYMMVLLQRYSLAIDGCIACAPNTYNAGGMSWDATDCFVVETSEIVFKDATSVACNAAFDYWGTPVYSGGAYDTGCQECDEEKICSGGGRIIELNHRS